MTKSQPHSSETVPQRRMFLKLLTALMGAVAAAMIAIPGAGYFFAALRRDKSEQDWIKLGPLADFPEQQTLLKVIAAKENPLAEAWDGVTGKNGVYVRYLGRDENFKHKFNVFAINCTHLGCPVEWFPQSGLFMCPCHGGVYYENGDHASGPPPRGLYHCVWKVDQANGDDQPQLYVQAPFLPTLQHTLTGREET